MPQTCLGGAFGIGSSSINKSGVFLHKYPKLTAHKNQFSATKPEREPCSAGLLFICISCPEKRKFACQWLARLLVLGSRCSVLYDHKISQRPASRRTCLIYGYVSQPLDGIRSPGLHLGKWAAASPPSWPWIISSIQAFEHSWLLKPVEERH